MNVLKKLDGPNLFFKDKKSLAFFLKFFQRIKKLYNINFPESILFSHWKNKGAQVQFVTHLFNCGQPELLNFLEVNKRLVNMDFNPLYKYAQLTPPVIQFWGCLDFLELLVELADGEFYGQVKALFEFPLQKCPDILAVGLAQVATKNAVAGSLIDDIFSSLFPLYLMNHANSIPILDALWKLNHPLMINAICEVFKREHSSLNLSRVKLYISLS